MQLMLESYFVVTVTGTVFLRLGRSSVIRAPPASSPANAQSNCGGDAATVESVPVVFAGGRESAIPMF
ncbi:MAG: hypothetical protein QGH60_15230 [Phycisphaerae bacterium]|nr:hypothetical protein [Phycisphaerae bacterium]